MSTQKNRYGYLNVVNGYLGQDHRRAGTSALATILARAKLVRRSVVEM